MGLGRHAPATCSASMSSVSSGLAKHQFHVALLLNCWVPRRITTLDESILPPECGSLWLWMKTPIPARHCGDHRASGTKAAAALFSLRDTMGAFHGRHARRGLYATPSTPTTGAAATGATVRISHRTRTARQAAPDEAQHRERELEGQVQLLRSMRRAASASIRNDLVYRPPRRQQQSPGKYL